jgi:hypothetical protein
VIGHVDSRFRQAPQFGAIRVAERIRIQDAVGDFRGAPSFRGDLSEVLEQKAIPRADRPSRGEECAAGVAHRVVVVRRRLVGRFGRQDELVPGIDDCPLGAAARRAAIELQPFAAVRIRMRVADDAPRQRVLVPAVLRQGPAGQLVSGVAVALRVDDLGEPSELVVVLHEARADLASKLLELRRQDLDVTIEAFQLGRGRR